MGDSTIAEVSSIPIFRTGLQGHVIVVYTNADIICYSAMTYSSFTCVQRAFFNLSNGIYLPKMMSISECPRRIRVVEAT